MANRNVTVKILGDAKGLTGALAVARGGLGTFSRGALLAGTAIAAGLVAAGAGLVKLGEKFDDAYDAIQVGTGATGEALEGLNQSFRDTLASGPHAFDDTATAIADLNTRLGLTGDPLEALADQILDLSRITKTDLSANTESITRVFGDWGIATDDMSGSMDELFRASQASGVPVDRLGNMMVQFGAPLRQLGFGFEETAAMISKFEAEGVNTELVMGSMRIALGKMAKAGEDAPDTFRRVTGEIAAMEDPTAATGLAIELFGTRAGPDMAAAIREGRFEIDDFLDTIENGESTITGTADATDSWREKLKTLSNKILVKLAPLADKVFTGVTNAMTKVSDWIEDHADEIEEITRGVWEWMERNVLPVVRRVFSGIVTAISTAVGWIKTNIGAIRDSFATAFGWLIENREVLIGAAIGIGAVLVAMFTAWAISAGAAAIATLAAAAPFIAIGLAVAALAAGILYAYNHFQIFRDIVDSVASFLTGTVWPAIQAGFNLLVSGVQAVWPVIQAAWDLIVSGATAVVGWFQDNWDTIRSTIAGVWERVDEIIQAGYDFWLSIVELFDDLIHGRWDEIWEDVKEILNNAWNYIKLIVQAAVDVLKKIIPEAWNIIKLGAAVAWGAIKRLIFQAWEGIKLAVQAAVNWVKTQVREAWERVKSTARVVWDLIKNEIFQKWEAIKLAVQSAVNWLKERISAGWTAIKDVAVWLWTSIKNAISTAWNTIRFVAQVGIDKVKEAVRTGINTVLWIWTGVWNSVSGFTSNVWEGIKSTVRNAVDWVVRKVNELIDAYNSIPLAPNIPTIGGGGGGGGIVPPASDSPHVQRRIRGGTKVFHSGGWVTGPEEQLAIVRRGEFVASEAEIAGRPRHDSPFRDRGGDIHFHNYNLTMTPGDIAMAWRRRRSAA